MLTRSLAGWLCRITFSEAGEERGSCCVKWMVGEEEEGDFVIGCATEKDDDDDGDAEEEEEGS